MNTDISIYEKYSYFGFLKHLNQPFGACNKIFIARLGLSGDLPDNVAEVEHRNINGQQ
jgi:hypothetical protein